MMIYKERTMMMKKTPYFDAKAPVRVISPKTDKSCFFGYYDLKAYDDTDSYHLCNIADFEDRLPTDKDVLEMGVIDLSNGNFEKIAETTSWNFQQGALLQWHRQKKDTVFYNVFKDGEYITVQKNVKTGAEKYVPACANISRDGKLGLKVNFSRIYDFRPGYGYCNVKDPFHNVNQPEDDGIFLVDMETGKEKLLVNYAEMAQAVGTEIYTPDVKLLINHITFNPSGTKFIVLLRNFRGEPGTPFGTSLLAIDLEGNIKVLMRTDTYSHYDWKDDDILLGYCSDRNGVWGLSTVDVNTGIWFDYRRDICNDDIHCLYSNDRTCFIGDDYPNQDGYRRIYYYDVKTDESIILLQSYSPFERELVDIRTDLHNRWNTKNDKFSFDTIHNGKREICEMDLRGTRFDRSKK